MVGKQQCANSKVCTLPQCTMHVALKSIRGIPELLEDVFELTPLAEPELPRFAHGLLKLQVDICRDCPAECNHLQRNVKLICHLYCAIWKLDRPDCLCMLCPH